MKERKAIRLRPSQGGSMARSVGPDDETRARIAASDARALAAHAQVVCRSRRDSRKYFIPSPYNLPSDWRTPVEAPFYDAGDGDVAIVREVNARTRLLCCEFFFSSGKRGTPLMTVYEDETTGWRELTPDEVRSFREKIAKAHGEAYEHAIYVERTPQAVKVGQWYDTGGAYLEVIKVCERNRRHLCDVYRRNGELMGGNEPFSGKELSTHRMLTEDESTALRNTIQKKEIGYNEFDFI